MTLGYIIAQAGQTMPESEMFRLVLQGGAFALLLVVIVLFVKYFWPEMKEYRLDNKAAREESNNLVLKLQITYVEDMKSVRVEFQAALNDAREKFQQSLSESVEKFVSEARSARKDFLAWNREEAEQCRKDRLELEERWRADHEADRIARNAQTNEYQKHIADLFDRLLSLQERAAGHDGAKEE